MERICGRAAGQSRYSSKRSRHSRRVCLNVAQRRMTGDTSGLYFGQSNLSILDHDFFVDGWLYA